MRNATQREAARHITAAILLALALPVFGGSETHSRHRPGEAETPIFAEASHAGQANHWEAAGSARASRCPACLAPAHPLGAAPKGATKQVQNAIGSAPTGGPTDLPDPAVGHSQRPRAPPHF